MNRRFRYVLSQALLLGCATALLWWSSLIAYYGSITISELNPALLTFEIVAMIGIMVFAVYNLVRYGEER